MRRRIEERLVPRLLGLILAALVPMLAAAGPPGPVPDPASSAPGDPWINDRLQDLVGLYTHLHTHPELSYQEQETSRRMAEELPHAHVPMNPITPGRSGLRARARRCRSGSRNPAPLDAIEDRLVSSG